MNLYQVFNGYMGDGPVFVIVLAENKQKAWFAASEALKKNAFFPARNEYAEDRYLYSEDYWTDLEVKFLSVASAPFVSKVEGG